MIKLKAKNKKSNTGEITAIKWLMLISALNILLTMIICSVAYFADADTHSTYLITIAIQCIGLFITGYMTGRKFRKNGMLMGVLFNSLYIITVLLTALILCGFTFDSRMITTLFLMISISAVGGIVSVNTHKKR